MNLRHQRWRNSRSYLWAFLLGCLLACAPMASASARTLALAMLMSFSYGVLHTLGSGHGKAVIVSYFVGNGGSLRRGMAMGVRIAVFHVLSAVMIVVLTDAVIQQVGGSSAGCFTCEDRQGIGGWLALAVGAVPCSGALLALLYGLANDLLWPSVAMVVSISVGMAFTLGWIGAIAIMGNHYGHQLADRRQEKLSWEKPRRKPRFSLIQAGQVIGASCVSLLGIGLFSLTLIAGS